MVGKPALELLSLPALREVVLKDGDRGFQRRASQEPEVVVPSLVTVRAIDPTSQGVCEMPQRKRVSHVQLHLEIGLLPVRRK